MTTERSRLIDLLFGFFPAQVIQTMARLSVPDHLASGPMPIAELAAATGTHQPSLYRLFRGGEVWRSWGQPESVTRIPPPTAFSVLRAVPA